MKRQYSVAILLALSLISHFIFFGHPKETVFDEVHFGKFITGYFTHQYFFDIHPPLGKLLISAMGYVGNFKPGFSFAEIGEKFPDQTYLWLRFLPILAGALLPIIIFFLALELGFSEIGALAAGLFTILESSLLVQSRLILLDSFLLLFGFTALLVYFKYQTQRKPGLLLASSALATFSMSVKWTGATFLAIIFGLELFNFLKKGKLFELKPIFNWVVSLLIFPFLIYFSIFAIHLKLLNQSGPGDAFMTPGFQKTLAGNSNTSNSNIRSLGLFSKFLELNAQMYKSNAGLTASHPYSSQWYTWPFMVRPIYYWYQADGIKEPELAKASRIYLIGNPIIWWASTVAVFYILISLLMNFIYRNPADITRRPKVLFLIGAFLLNLLPFIGIKRAMFLYHYMTALVFAILILTFLIDQQPRRKIIFGTLISSGLIAFLFFSPLIYGLPLADQAYNLRAWFASWK